MTAQNLQKELVKAGVNGNNSEAFAGSTHGTAQSMPGEQPGQWWHAQAACTCVCMRACVCGMRHVGCARGPPRMSASCMHASACVRMACV